MATGSTGVYGGVDYNTADAATKKKLVQTKLKLDTDSSFKQSETARALQAYKDRLASGLDTSAQSKYLTSQLGYTGALPSASTASATSSATPTAAKTNASQSSELTDLMKSYATKQATPFSYDAESDPAYQAALTRARSNIEAGNAQTQAELNQRGILNSTITSDRMAETAANEMGEVETSILPQLMQQAYQKYLNDQAYDQQQFANQGTLASMYDSADQQAFDNTITEANLTGNYTSTEAQNYIDQLLSLKQQAEAAGITAAERTKLSNQADALRAKLQSMGIDSSKYGANVSAAQAASVNSGVRTLAGQSQDLATRQQDTAESQYAENMAYQKARDAISDSQWQQTFDENVKQNGLSYALQKLSQENSAAYQQAQLAISQDENARSWLSYGDSQTATTASEYSGMTANQIYDAVRSSFLVTDDKTGTTSLPTDSASKEAMYQQVMGSGLPDGQDTQVLSLLGLTSKEIAAYDKKYGVSGN